MVGPRDPASFRDPSGHIYILDGRVYRTVMPRARDDYEFVRSTGVLQRLARDGRVISATEAPRDALPVAEAEDAAYVIEHPAVPFISYPYEWSFPGLKAAALLTLDVHLEALDHEVTLSDASAYNIQFIGARPIFIDYLSFRRYREGEFWIGHRQFCEQFLNPLLLTSLTGVPYQAWYRGSVEGIRPSELKPLLPRWRRLSWKVFTHVVLQAGFSRRQSSKNAARLSGMKLPLEAYRRMLRSMRRWVAGLTPAKSRPTIWVDYTNERSYTDDEVGRKVAFVREFVQATQPSMLWDIGCNTGEYSQVAVESGARTVVGFENDHGALDTAFARASEKDLPILPLYLDAANPSPSEGWNQAERKGLRARASADAILALAVVHHLAIGRNIPLDQVVEWLANLAPVGVIEFVPKADPMVHDMLRLREDVFDDYTEAVFLQAIQRHGDVVKSTRATASGRLLVWYRRR